MILDKNLFFSANNAITYSCVYKFNWAFKLNMIKSNKFLGFADLFYISSSYSY